MTISTSLPPVHGKSCPMTSDTAVRRIVTPRRRRSSITANPEKQAQGQNLDRLEDGIPPPGFVDRNTPECIRQPFTETKKRHSPSKLLIREESDPESRILPMSFSISGTPDCQQAQNACHPQF
jgi:hypothetical protein